MCIKNDFHQCVPCAQAGTDLPDCPKVFGKWKNVGQCNAIHESENCGPGTQLQERTCQNGTGQEICLGNDTSQIISCRDAGSDLSDCPKSFGPWENFGSCFPLNTKAVCGPGNQQQRRTCKNGTGLQICTNNDTFQLISCKDANSELPDCPKKYGRWENQGPCISLGPNPVCGPGNQKQNRDCTNGTGSEVCSEEDRVRIISCLDAESPLPDCPKTFSEWKNTGQCMAIIDLLGNTFSCGPGEQKQVRTCTDGTGLLICSNEERTQYRTLPCMDAGTELPECPGKYENSFFERNPRILYLYYSYIIR